VDLPADGTRLYAEARGVDTGLVNGGVIPDVAGLAGVMSCNILRWGRGTDSVAAT
jgi:hypothetical protein